MKTKNIALEKLMNKPPSNPATFEKERPQRPGYEGVLTLHRPKNDILAFFKFLQKKVSRLDKKAPALFCIVLGVVICKNHVAKPLDSFNKCRKIILSCRETFFGRNLKNARMSFLGRCNVETASCPGLQGLSCSKVAGFEGGFMHQLFKGYIFCFHVHSDGRCIFELSAHETNLMKKRSVRLWASQVCALMLMQYFTFIKIDSGHTVPQCGAGMTIRIFQGILEYFGVRKENRNRQLSMYQNPKAVTK